MKRADKDLIGIIEHAGVDIVLSLPCNMLSGILQGLSESSIRHIPVCREEEGVGIAAGAALAGNKPLLLMQNSGFGNCMNALLSLTRVYALPLFIMMSHRGGPTETIAAQIPMGKAVPRVLAAIEIECRLVACPEDTVHLQKFIADTYEENTIRSALLAREFWHETS